MKEGLLPEAVQLQNQVILDQLSHEFGLAIFTPIYAGERNVPLFRSLTEDGRKLVVKIGTGGEEQQDEVESNIVGYQAIDAVGAAAILPEDLHFRYIKDAPIIVMTDLGDDFGDQAKAGDTSVYDTFLSSMSGIYAASMSRSPEGQLPGLKVTKDMLSKWYGEVVAKGGLSETVLGEIEQLDIKRLNGTQSTLLLMDFTPNNVFVGDGKVSFIDPWLQDTYVGSPIPSIGQFITLADDVHGYPGAAENRDKFIGFTHKLGENLGLSPEQTEAQFNLGAALQLSLSGYIRIGGEQDERGRRYAKKGAGLIDQLLR